MYKENKQPNWRYFPEQNTFYQRMQTRGTFTNNFDIANCELAEKRMPFIIRRLLPAGQFEYWKLEDLEIF